MSHYRNEAEATIAAIVKAADPGILLHELKRQLVAAGPHEVFTPRARIWHEEVKKAIQKERDRRAGDGPLDTLFAIPKD